MDFDFLKQANLALPADEKNLNLIQNSFLEVVKQSFHATELDPLLLEGIKISIFRSITIIVELGISPLDHEILPEYKVLIGEIKEVYHHLNPEPNSNWLEECIAYGEKKAYHWDWKHFGSKELF